MRHLYSKRIISSIYFLSEMWYLRFGNNRYKSYQLQLYVKTDEIYL